MISLLWMDNLSALYKMKWMDTYKNITISMGASMFRSSSWFG